MNLIDIDNGIVETRQVIHSLLHALLKVTTILRAGKHRSHVYLVYLAPLECVGHIAVLDALSQTVD